MTDPSPVVLVIDDEVQIRRFLRAGLELDGFVLQDAETGADSLKWVTAKQPDLIILDVMMAKMDSWDTCERLKADPATKHIPIIMLTSLDAVDVPARARQAGVAVVLMKPCPAERLVLAITAARQPAVDRGRDSA